MSVFFNGRLWVSPATMSVVDDSKMYSRGLSVGNNLALIGRADGGEPDTALKFGSVSEARAVLRGGDLLRAVERAFNASSQSPGPSSITVVRVNPATQSTLVLKDAAAADSITLESTNYGLIDNQIKVKVEAGTNVGLKVTSQFGTSYCLGDDLARNALTIQYSGTGTGTLTLNNTTATLILNAITTAIDLNSYSTVQTLVDRLNAITGITAAVADGNGEKPALNGLDGLTTQDIKTSVFTVTANLQAVVDWFNGNGETYITATRSGTKVPVAVAFSYLSGGSDGTVTNTEWTAAFTTLQAEDVQWVVPLSSASAIHAMADTHVAYMSDVARQERRAICGMASGSTDAQAITAAKAINSDRTSLTHLGIYDYDTAGALVLFEPYIAAAMIAGAFAGLNPGTALTNKSLKIRGLERKLRNPTDTDALITGGVLCIEDTPTGYKVVQSISTWLVNDNYNRREISVGVALDFTMRNVRNAVDDLRGAKNNPVTLSLAVERAESALRELARPEPAGPGVLAGDAASPAYKNITASADGDVLRIEFQCSPVIPANYIPITCYAVPFSGKATSTPAQ
jgi:hypothetical protein